jgi:8-oxo-dGTP diphosphatase
MTAYYLGNPQFLVSVDCIIFGFQNNMLKLLLQKRNFEPFEGQWSLMGGFVQENESVDDAAKRVLMELSGLTDISMHQVGAFGRVDRDPGARVISVAYYTLVNADLYPPEKISKNFGYWENIYTLPDLYFDHNEMVRKAWEKLKTAVSEEPLVFNLLPKLFTLTQIQTLYEAIMGKKLDKRNFRKRISNMDFIEKTEFIDKLSSYRGAYLYRFNEKAYNKNPDFKL